MSNGNGLSKVITLPQAQTCATPIQLKPIVTNVNAPPWSETVTVTPELAEFWLKANTRNRHVRKSRVKQYARDMAAGRWLFNTQGVTFGTDGSLIDGQHRLSAVVLAGVPVTMVVWFNVPPASRSVIDIGVPRNLADIGELTNMQAAVTQAMMRGMAGKSVPASMAEKVAFYRRFSIQIDGSIARFASFRKGITQASVIGVIARASLHMSEPDIDRFCAVLQSGLNSEDRDVTVIRLRDRLMSGLASIGGSAVLREIYALTASALRSFSEGKAVKLLRPATSDPFPLPEFEIE